MVAENMFMDVFISYILSYICVPICLKFLNQVRPIAFKVYHFNFLRLLNLSLLCRVEGTIISLNHMTCSGPTISVNILFGLYLLKKNSVFVNSL